MLGTAHIKSLSLSQYGIGIRINQKSEIQDRRPRNRYKNFTCDKASSKINIEMIVDIINYVWLFEIPWTVVCQAPLSMGTLQAGILEWVAMLSSRRSFQPTDWTQVSHITGGFFTIWATRETQEYWSG